MTIDEQIVAQTRLLARQKEYLIKSGAKALSPEYLATKELLDGLKKTRDERDRISVSRASDMGLFAGSTPNPEPASDCRQSLRL